MKYHRAILAIVAFRVKLLSILSRTLKRARTMNIEDAVIVVTDTETTGTDASRNRLIEIAAVKVTGGEEVDTFSQLINPGCAVPRRITGLTGISTGMVFDQPDTGTVLPAYLDFLGDAVFVAHNLPFDQGFIQAELARLGTPWPGNPGLCTLRLARRLLRGLRSKSLSSVADFYGLRLKNRHRALGDAQLTARILLRFLSSLSFNPGLETLEEVLAFQNTSYARAATESKHLRRIREEVLPRLPERPGVYFMKDGKGDVVYIGKARQLRTRVRSYFSAIEAHPPRIRQLVDAIRDIAWTETGSELGALLLESRLIKEQKPRFNRAERRYRNRPFIRLDVSHPFPRLDWCAYLTDDGAEYFGPLPGRRQAELVVELVNRRFQLRECDDDTFARARRCLYAEMGRCGAPCVDRDVAGSYDREVQRVRDFLTGKDRGVLDWIGVEMKKAADRLDFEQAGTYRDWLEALTPMLDKQEAIAAPVLDHHAVLLLPGVASETVQLLLVRFGRLVAALTVSLPLDAEAEATVRAHLSTHFDPTLARPERYDKREVDEVRILAHWLYVHREDAHRIPWRMDMAARHNVEAVLRRLREVAPALRAAWEDR